MLLPNVLPPLLIHRQVFPPLLVPMQCCRCLFQCNVTAASSNFCRSWFQCAAAAAFKLLLPMLLPLYRHRCCFQCITVAAAAPHCIIAAAAAPNILLPSPMYRRLCCFQCVTSTLVSNVSPPGNCLRGCFRFVVTGAASGVVSPLLAAVINRVQMRDDSVIIIKNLKEKHTLPGKDIRCGRQSSGRNRLTLP